MKLVGLGNYHDGGANSSEYVFAPVYKSFFMLLYEDPRITKFLILVKEIG